MNTVTTAIAGVLVLGGAAVAQTPITDMPANDVAALGVTNQLNLSASSFGASLSGGGNTFVSNFMDTVQGMVVAGTITSEVFANVSTPGSSLTDVVIKYTLTNTGTQNLDSFDFGVNGGANLDAGDINRADQGTLINDTTVGQISPAVSIDTLSSNPLWKFDFLMASAGSDQLEPGETFTWYIKSDGDNAVGIVDVFAQDSFPAIGQALAFVDQNAGQPDLNVPAPGALALGLFGAAFATRRRRA